LDGLHGLLVRERSLGEVLEEAGTRHSGELRHLGERPVALGFFDQPFEQRHELGAPRRCEQLYRRLVAILDTRDRLAYSELMAMILLVGVLDYALDTTPRWLCRRWQPG
jgi:hypothetical protein